MKIDLLLRLALCILIIVAAPLGARSADDDFRQFRAKDQIELRPDKAYLLLRMDTDLYKFHLHVLRIPSDQEVDDFFEARREAFEKAGARGSIENFPFNYQGKSNFFDLDPKKYISKAGKIANVLAEVDPGDYVVYGMGYNEYLHQCFCLGTVGFEAKAGEITDLGTMITAKAWEPSDIPELAGETGLGKGAMVDFGLFAVALVPSGENSQFARLNSSKIEPADFHAVGPYTEPNSATINRLAPMPGVLAYRQGRVIDEATGKELPPNWQ